MRRALVGILAAALLTGWHAPVQAAPAPEDLAVIRNLWARARLAETEGRWKACEEDLTAAVELVPTPGLLYHLAYCKEQQRLWVEALTDYRRAEQLIRSGVAADDVQELLHATLARLEVDIPTLRLQVSDLPPGATLYIAGKQYPTDLIGRPIAQNPGARTIQLAAPGYLPVSQELNLVPREARTLTLVLTPEERAPAAPLPAPVSAKPFVMIGEAGLILAGVGAGVVFALEHSARERDRRGYLGDLGESGCVNSSQTTCVLAARAQTDARRAQRDMWIGFSAAGVGVVAFFATWWLWPTEGETRAHVAINPEPDGVRATLTGTF
jgi:hypothetical protein